MFESYDAPTYVWQQNGSHRVPEHLARGGTHILAALLYGAIFEGLPLVPTGRSGILLLPSVLGHVPAAVSCGFALSNGDGTSRFIL